MCFTFLPFKPDFKLVSSFRLSYLFQSDAGWEEYYDYIFPDDEANRPNFKLLQMARMWKQAKDADSDDDDDEGAKSSDEEGREDDGGKMEDSNQDKDTDLSSDSSSDDE